MSGHRTISVIGLGYIGLPTAATFANAGYQVIGVDVRPEVVDAINRGEIHIAEQGLDILVRAAVQRGKLRASLEPRPADVHIIAVPTPICEDKSFDASFIEAATHLVAKVLKPGDLVIVESTIPPRTCVDVVAPLIETLTGFRHQGDYLLAHCPERVIPGKILHEIIYNDRIIGGASPEATECTAALYGSFVKGQLLKTDIITAELCKLMENTYRDVNIALANEFADIAEGLGIDVNEAIRHANHHPRVNIHSPGIGVGGHCIPIDPWFIVHSMPDKTRLIRLAREINDQRPQRIANHLVEILRHHPNQRMALLGLSYKPDVDDMRESPAIHIVEAVAEIVVDPILIVEPHARALPPVLAAYPQLQLVDVATAIAEAEILVVLTEHSRFKETLPQTGADKLIINAQNIFQLSDYAQETSMAL